MRIVRRPDVLAVGVATTYVSVATTDLKLGGVPLKLVVVGFGLIMWLVYSRPWTERPSGFLFRTPILLGAIVVPCVWFLVAAWLAHEHDPAQRHGLSDAAQEASRFIYLLLYFPLADRRWLGAGWDRLWRWPTLVVCAITVGLFVAYLFGAHFDGTGTVGPFQGAVAVDRTGVFRAFLINDVLFLVLFAWLFARVAAGNVSGSTLLSFAVLLFAMFLAHTRAIWLGACVSVVTILLAAASPVLPTTLRRLAWTLLTCGWIGALLVSSDPSAVHGLVNLVTGGNEQSTADRFAQGPQLLAGFDRHVLYGSGLGATLPTGFLRDASAPWSFELTYLQLLFELGLAGFVLVVIPILTALVRLGRALMGTTLEQQPDAFAALAGILAFVLAAASNPYLLTSVGMYALAVLLAIVDRASASRARRRRSWASAYRFRSGDRRR